ncbi:MAG: hypothetical protein B7733_21920 [Myxococcales bacterium FL481]|nr:MAG: hypothetical protein B7733_21920 [Myxococcales bacterium FL481]
MLGVKVTGFTKAAEFTKHDGGKPRPDLLPPLALMETSAVLEFGARKYAPGNWRKVEDRQRYMAATLRHLLEYQSGKDADPESKLHVLAHAACSLLFLLECELAGLGADTRPGK